MKVFYSPEYTLARHKFDTTRKSRWIAESLKSEPIVGVELCEPLPVTERQLCEVHDAGYVAAMRTGNPRDLAESQGFEWDPLMWPMLLASTGGVVAAARAAQSDGVSGSLSSGLHHAKRGHGDGFCTFNGLVVAARDALARGANSILILDLDAHCGGGTYSLVASDSRFRHADIAVSTFDSYVLVDHNSFTLVHNAADYLATVGDLLRDLEQVATYDLCLYNAGMDPHEECTIGGLSGITRSILQVREQMVFSWCRRHHIPVAFVLAGGYVSPQLTEDQLVDLHRLSLTAAVSI